MSGGGRLARVGGLLVALSGVHDQTQQVGLVERSVVDPEPAVLATEALFAGVGWSPAFDLVAGDHPGLEEVLTARGYRVVIARPGMVRSLVEVEAPVDDQVHVEVATTSQLGELAAVQSRAFAMPLELCQALLPPTAATIAGLEVLVVLDESGSVVGGLSLHLDGEIAGIVGAAVEPDRQRVGFGARLTIAALERARRHGSRDAWLQATPAGLALWQAQGFEEVASCQVWLASHPVEPELRHGPRPTGL